MGEKLEPFLYASANLFEVAVSSFGTARSSDKLEKRSLQKYSNLYKLKQVARWKR
jgi:hypothetical protein